MSGLIAWGIFLALSLVSLMTAAGMLLTMSMYRAGLALMASFIALAGLFILLDADLLAAIQIMMNVGGMLVMVLFMVMIMIDPGGEMMWDMKRKMRLLGPGAFSMSMPRGKPPEPEATRHEQRYTEGVETSDWTCPMHPEVSQPGPGDCPICSMPLVPRGELGARAEPHKAPVKDKDIYTCPMHPHVHQEEPGSCPICGMDLVPVEEQQHGEPKANHEPTYTCPMHPEVRQQAPGPCPECGMDLVPIKETGAHEHEPGEDHEHQGMATDEMGSDMHGMEMMKMNPRQHYQMMVDMAMSTAQLPWALAIGAVSAALLIVLVVATPWPLSPTGPSQDATTMVGELLLSRYMIGFEGAAFLILAGMVGAVVFAMRDRLISSSEALPDLAEKEALAHEHRSTQAAESSDWTCLMHPEASQSGPGDCPICSMPLVPRDELEHPYATAEPAQARTDDAQIYTCPTHLQVRQGSPGQCPICSMDLVLAEEPS